MHEDEPSVKCAECAAVYHFGKCAGVTEKSFRGKNVSAKETWRCPTCRSATPRAESRGSVEPEIDINLVLASINQKLDSLPRLTEKVEAMEKSLQFMSNKFDEFELKFSRQDNEIKELKKRVTELEDKDDTNQVNLTQLQEEINDLEYRSRQLNLEIHGIPKAENENLLALLNNVAEKLDVPPLAQSDLAAVHRLPS